MKLLFVSTVAGTISAFLNPYALAFREIGWRVEAAACGIDVSRNALRGFDDLHEIEWSRNPFHLRSQLKSIGQIRSLVERNKYDVVHVHTPIASFLTRFALRAFPRDARPKVVYTAHGFHFYKGNSALKNFLFSGAERIAGNWTDHLITINQEDYDYACRLKILPESQISLFPGIGVDLNEFSLATCEPAEVKELEAELSIPADCFRLLMIAEFNPGKRHIDVLNALRILRGKNVVAIFAGVGPLEPEIKSKAIEMNVVDQCRFVGFRTDIKRFIALSSAVILPSLREGLPRSIMEALAMERPVIGTDIRGVRDLIERDSGIVVPVRDPEAIAAAIVSLSSDVATAREMGRKGRIAAKKYSFDSLLASHMKLYGILVPHPRE